MAPTTSLRSLFTYANNVISQVPNFGSLPHGISDSISSIFETSDTSGSGSPANSNSNFLPYTAADNDEYQPLFDGVTPYDPLSGAPTCPVNGPMSCNNQTAADSCCFIHPGGRLLLTQFWDQEVHVGGSEEDWTLHGLWYGFPQYRHCSG